VAPRLRRGGALAAFAAVLAVELGGTAQADPGPGSPPPTADPGTPEPGTDAPPTVEDGPPPGRDLAFGLDFRLGTPAGVLSLPLAIGIDAVAALTPGVELAGGLEASGIVIGLRGGTTLSPLRWFDPGAEWSPSLGGSYAALFFTRSADELLERFAPGARDDLAEVGTDVTFAGMRLHTVALTLGVDFQKRPRGFHFRAEGGRTRMVGRAHGNAQDPDEMVVIDGYESWTFSLAFGWRG